MQITRGNYSNQHAREIIGEEMEKISKITSRSALAATYLEEHKSRGTDEIPENLSEKMQRHYFPAIQIRMRQDFSMEIAVGMIFIIQIWKNSKNV